MTRAEADEIVRRTRIAQGLPPTITDEAEIRRLHFFLKTRSAGGDGR